MTVTVTNKSTLTVPAEVQRQAGIKAGDRLKFKVSGGLITIIPKLPSAKDEYTPEQRRIIDAQLDEAGKGPFHGPFASAKKAGAYIERLAKERSASKKPKRPVR